MRAACDILSNVCALPAGEVLCDELEVRDNKAPLKVMVSHAIRALCVGGVDGLA